MLQAGSFPCETILESWRWRNWLGLHPPRIAGRARPTESESSPCSIVAAFLSITPAGRHALPSGYEDGLSQECGGGSGWAPGGSGFWGAPPAPPRGLRGVLPRAEPAARAAAGRAVRGPALPRGRSGRGWQRMLRLRAVAPELEGGVLFPQLWRLPPGIGRTGRWLVRRPAFRDARPEPAR